MADKKTSDEAAAATLDGSELLRAVQGGANVKLTVSQVMAAVLLLLGDTDSTLAANSDSKFATQKALKTAIAAAVAGLSWKQEVRAATTANGTLATAFANGQAIDGVTLATGDRILVKNQSSASANGIYTVNASGAPTRATDADSGAELVDASVYVSEGTTNADTQWVCTTNAPITVGTTSLAFAQLTTGGGTSFAYAAQAWVEASGNDGTGTLGKRDLPFATIDAALDALPSTGGDIFIGLGAAFGPITSDVVAGGSSLNGSSKLKSYVRFFGAGMPALDSETAPTTLVATSGTVIKGPIYVHSTRHGVEFHNLGVDSGSAVCTALYAGASNIDALVWANVGQVGSQTPARDPVVANVRCLAQSATAAVHALCLENVVRPYANNLDLVFGTHGLAYKCVDGRISNIVSRGHSSECFIFKESNTNNDTAPCHDNVASNLVCDQIGSGDTPTAISLQTASTRPMERLSIANVVCRNMTTYELSTLTTCTSGTPGLVQNVKIANFFSDNGALRTSLASLNKNTIFLNGQSLDGTVALVDVSSIATDASKGNVFAVTLGGNRTLANPTNMLGAQTYLWRITQDGTGSRTLAYGSKFKFPGGTAPTLSTAAGKVDIVTGVYDAASDTIDAVANLAFS